MAVDGQSYREILTHALSASPHRPSNWNEGTLVQYTILRDGQQETVTIRLIRLSDSDILRNLIGNFLKDPSPLLMFLIAIYVFFRLPRNRSAQILFLFSAAVFSSDGISQSITGSNLPGLAELFFRNVYWPTQFYTALIWPLLIAPLYIHLFLVFPEIRAPLREYSQETLFAIYGFMPVLTVMEIIINIGRPIIFWSTWSTLSQADFVIVLLITIFIMVYNLTRVTDIAGRAQVRWIAWGAVITSINALLANLLIAAGLSGQPMQIVWFISRLVLMALPITVAIAILRFHLFDIDVIINRTLVYGTVTALLLLVYLTCVVLLQSIFRLATGQNSQIAVIISTLTIATLFTPIRQRVQEVIDRRFYRRKYNAARILDSFSIAARDEVELESLTAEFLRVVEETVQPARISLWLVNLPDKKDGSII